MRIIALPHHFDHGHFQRTMSAVTTLVSACTSVVSAVSVLAVVVSGWFVRYNRGVAEFKGHASHPISVMMMGHEHSHQYQTDSYPNSE